MGGLARALSVLIVEDHPDGAESMGQLLDLYGFETHIAHSTAEGLTVAAEFPPDVVLLDLQLSDGSGYQLAHALCDRLKKKPVFIVMTGFHNREAESRREGMDHHFVKPLDPGELRELLQRYAGGTQS